MDPANVRPIQEGAVNALLEAEKVAEATKQAIKRKIAQAASVDFQARTLPPKLRIEPDDPEDVVMYSFCIVMCSFCNIFLGFLFVLMLCQICRKLPNARRYMLLSRR